MTKLSGSNVMVTGGCGFIGSHLVRRVVENEPRKVLVIDALKYGAKANLGKTSGNVEVVPFRLGTDSIDQLSELVAGVDYLFHLAAEKHHQSRDNPRELVRSNIDGALELFELAAKHKVKKVVFSSSLYAYGRMSGPPMIEDEPPSPRTLYGLSKLMGERLLGELQRTAGLAHAVLRYFFVYGPRQYAGMGYKSVIVRNFERILQGQSPVVYGDGRQALDYSYVDDVVRATILAMESDVSDEIVNVGSGTATTIQELTETMLRVAGSELNIAYEAPDWTAGSCRKANTEKIRRILQWTPQISLERGLQLTWDWMREGKP